VADKTACVCFKPGDIYGKNDLKNRFTVERVFNPFCPPVCLPPVFSGGRPDLTPASRHIDDSVHYGNRRIQTQGSAVQRRNSRLDAFRPKALPSSVVIPACPGVEIVTPALAMMVPTM